MTNKTFFALILSAMMCVPFTMSAQVTIGSGRAPSEWSLLDLCTDEQRKALHNARMDRIQRDLLMSPAHPEAEQLAARGLLIFRTDYRRVSETPIAYIGCLEFWNGIKWVSLCEDRLPWLRVNPEYRIFGSIGGTQIFNVDTSMRTWSVGWIIPESGEPAPAPAGFTLTYNAANNTFTVVAANNPGAERGGLLRVTAGNLYQNVLIRQLPDASVVGDVLYPAFVGAFWRNNQQGERLIQMPNPSAAPHHTWTAVALDNWIVLDDYNFTIPAPVQSIFANNVDVNHRLPANAAGTITGEGEFRFRIGLTSYNGAPNNPPRYSQVALFWGQNEENIHIIWIRQGEAADYLMRPIDNRDFAGAARRFSPFNLTGQVNAAGVPQFPHAVNNAFDIPLASAGGYGQFVRYPTQAGAHFHYARRYDIDGTTRSPRAFHPTAAIVSNWQEWGGEGSLLGYWGGAATGICTCPIFNCTCDNLRADFEVCPPGYRRPHDGFIVGIIPGTTPRPRSEIRQSLMLNPTLTGTGGSLDNSVRGMYADGFFDRHRSAAATVSVYAPGAPATVAYRGRLLFNPATRASLFLPASGFRGPHLGTAGNVGIFMSTTRTQTRTEARYQFIWSFRIDARPAEHFVGAYQDQLGQAHSIRCVRRPSPDNDPSAP